MKDDTFSDLILQYCVLKETKDHIYKTLVCEKDEAIKKLLIQEFQNLEKQKDMLYRLLLEGEESEGL
jgi:hypothetical protein